jgi:hypothetical protein
MKCDNKTLGDDFKYVKKATLKKKNWKQSKWRWFEVALEGFVC